MFKQLLFSLALVPMLSQAELVGRWDFNQNVTDTSGNNIHSESLGESPVSYIERGGEYAAFFGGNSYVALDHNYWEPIEAIGFSLWFNTSHSVPAEDLNTMAQNWSLIDFDRSEFFNLSISSNGNAWFGVTFGEGTAESPYYTYDLFSDESYNDGEWHQVVASYGSQGGLQIFIDDVLAISDIYRGDLGRSNVTRYGFLGDGSEANAYDGGRNYLYYEGGLDNVLLYDEEFTFNEVSNLFQHNSIQDVPLPVTFCAPFLAFLLSRRLRV
ncbi:hypothetical protein BM525_19910 (plasmid) [Alteromonas mediterranea]|uniref:Laminin G domain-containing protein n=1 Tax=Alteromonas mediterranea TaxID=314275 RepID=A0AAC9JGL3_9ALTE|nr:LamG-like jellyroll fold domain-containing protein [Alteromonas mediterranea]APD92150.1 hypothetical protein BM524_19715 [Alteromonas mediterranea]APE00005.1 hypothetical protein BM525_19910 [Alteromonas mediterranea]